MDGVRWRTRNGPPWRDVPERCGPWDRVYCLAAGSETGRGPGSSPSSRPELTPRVRSPGT
ncbi:transposase [Streptomyces vinaceus]|uniref:transposase n=1 Tax=Streptomyces vinaceus TaxID=1960 RepID=UPI001E2FD67C|nr:transposase [Streptomyces vinaceus]